MANVEFIAPIQVQLHTQSKTLDIQFANDRQFTLPCEYLRVYSPSAEVRGHGGGHAVLQTGKREVGFVMIEPVGHYALKIIFDDGHDSGLFSWSYLYELGEHYEAYWQDYLRRLEAAGASWG